MNHSLGILSSGVKFALHLVYFMTNFELQLHEATKFLGQVETSEITETTEKQLNKVTAISTTKNKKLYTQKSI